MTILIKGNKVVTKLIFKGCAKYKLRKHTSGLKVLVQSQLVTFEIILMLIRIFMLWKLEKKQS